jgi:uncharacterized protein
VIISEERQSHLAHLITDGLSKDDIVDYDDDDKALRAAKKGIAEFVHEFVVVDESVRSKIATLKRNVMEGTPEWDVMYKKYYEEELRRRGKV